MSILALASDTLVGTAGAGQIEYNGQFFGTDSNASRAQLQRITSGTAVASTSGTSIDFTGIPAWVEKITVMFSGVSTNGTSAFALQIGDSGGVETSGYFSICGNIETGGSATAQSSTASFLITRAPYASSAARYGTIVLSLLDAATFTWTAFGNIASDDTTQDIIYFSSGGKSLTATLDRIRITTAGGTDTFDAGTVNIIYEG